MFVRAAFLLSTLAAAAPALAQATPTVATTPSSVELKSGRIVRSADGRRVGEIQRVMRGQSGTPVSASVIYDGHFVSIPAATLSAAGSAYVSTLSLADIRKLK